ncbi:HD domain-containing protein [bacterium]|nr:HD domain-containing protein [bacterium]
MTFTDADYIVISRRFDDYVTPLLQLPDPVGKNILLKRDHTRRVLENANELCVHLKLSPEQARIAAAAALYHDIGRFPQFIRFRTFADSKSADHSLLGVDVIGEEHFFAGLDPAVASLLLAAIANHSRLVIPDSLPGNVRMLLRILRDADKLDILHVVTEYYRTSKKGVDSSIALDLPDTPGVSRNVMRSVREERLVNIADVRNVNDFKLLQVSWVYDLNFSWTKERLIERDYLTLLFEHLPDTPGLRELASRIRARISDISI